MQSNCQIKLGDEMVDLKITRSRRRSVSIIIYPNLLVEIKAPLRAKDHELVKRVEAKAGWVLKHRAKFKARGVPKPRQYVEGEEFNFLGQKYKLRHGSTTGVNGEFLDVATRSKSPVAVRAALRFWYNQMAHEVFTQRMSYCLQAVEGLKIPEYKCLNIKLMKRRWGSCATGRVITLNSELVSAPLECIDYVIIHELCHLREHNHGPRFYKLMSVAMPDWKARKALLNNSTETRFL